MLPTNDVNSNKGRRKAGKRREHRLRRGLAAGFWCQQLGGRERGRRWWREKRQGRGLRAEAPPFYPSDVQNEVVQVSLEREKGGASHDTEVSLVVVDIESSKSTVDISPLFDELAQQADDFKLKSVAVVRFLATIVRLGQFSVPHIKREVLKMIEADRAQGATVRSKPDAKCPREMFDPLMFKAGSAQLAAGCHKLDVIAMDTMHLTSCLHCKAEGRVLPSCYWACCHETSYTKLHNIGTLPC